MLQPYFNNDAHWAQTWQELGDGVPSLAGFARLCSLALAGGARREAVFSTEARAILYAARERGMVEIKGSNRAFDAPSRLLAVQVEVSPNQTLTFRNRDKPELTIRMLGGFGELCAAGYIMHHIYGEFSLTSEGFDLARTIPKEDVENVITSSTELESLE